MKIITVEEHFTSGEVMAWFFQARPHLLAARKQMNPGGFPAPEVLTDLGERRLAAMDRSGVWMQVIGYGANSPMLLRKEEQAVRYCRMANDCLYEGVQAHPDRFAGYATLPVDDPAEAVRELERCVGELGFRGWMINGSLEGEFLDSPRFWPIVEKAAELDVPIYLHPGQVQAPVFDRYYRGSWSESAAQAFASHGIGWHYDTAVHLLRLILSGLLDRLPTLKLIVGHWGELLPFYLNRMDRNLRRELTGLPRSIGAYFREQVYVNPAGMYFPDEFAFCLQVLPADHILWGQDYPFARGTEGCGAFLESFDLDPAVKEAIAHGNAQRLFRL